ncbi:hypothetical protein QAD02_013661 [Eretmocerus hayati]|uniref:Uncharacterized protein n=1 Tax=Eretmocerus hayati TaxID=131215 RepID=A0ACC2P2S2_9HYME|nr:hypothetical protein QAD02_013661 [Eretmocerus hayati]
METDQQLARQCGIQFPGWQTEKPRIWRKNKKPGKMQRLRKRMQALNHVEKLIDMGIWQPKPIRNEIPAKQPNCPECKVDGKCRECMNKIFLSLKIPRMRDKRRLNELMYGMKIKGDEQILRKFILQDWTRAD